uniref:Uncharacterized protein n=1 Tax=Craspedostauros australis TaxID=1486917 RepID=A0A7R9WW50_9STRA|mmetsp:Transcript_21334/g.59294  ORF Transcript_21334/g.59294 Transcript_21334/m.59294 type:complete len:141 (+) Transcript_21334:260-682(+)
MVGAAIADSSVVAITAEGFIQHPPTNGNNQGGASPEPKRVDVMTTLLKLGIGLQLCSAAQDGVDTHTHTYEYIQQAGDTTPRVVGNIVGDALRDLEGVCPVASRFEEGATNVFFHTSMMNLRKMTAPNIQRICGTMLQPP